jgi:DNA-binding MarR family transcriptional regulator
MSFDPLVANPGRLEILTALATDQRQEFALLRRRTNLTDGNLACHAKRLQSAGLIAIDKQFREGKPVTSYALTDSGRAALQDHVTRVMQAIMPADPGSATVPALSGAETTRQGVVQTAAWDEDESWVD